MAFHIGTTGEGSVSISEKWDDIVKDSPVSGKGMFVSTDVNAGEAFLSLPRPLVTALDNRRLQDTCANCYKWTADTFLRELVNEGKAPNLQICTGCRTLRYCSKQCQAESWKREHKLACKLLSALNQKGMLPNAGRAVLRMLHIAAFGAARQALMDMKSNLNEITARGGERAETLLIMSAGIHHYSGTPFGIEYVQNFFAVVLTNSLTVWTSTMDPLGIAVDPLAAKANHSCDPNAVVVWDGVDMQLRSLRPIKKGEEIFISYIDPTQPYSRRQHELDEKFYFKCQCSKCKLQWSGPNDEFLKTPKETEPYGMHLIMQETRGDIAQPILEDMTRKPIDSKDPDFLGTNMPQTFKMDGLFKGLKGLTVVQKMGNASFKASTAAHEDEHMTLLDAGLKACTGTSIWPDYRQPLPMIRHNALGNYLIMTKKYTEAYCFAFLQALKLYFDCFPKIYPQTFHPLRVVNKWTIAMIALVLAQGVENKNVKAITEQGVDWGVVIWGFLKEVLDNVQLSHGKGHRFAGVVKRKVDEVKTDMTRADPSKIRWAESQIENQWAILRKVANGPQANDFNQFKVV